MFEFSVRNHTRQPFLPTVCAVCDKTAAQCALKSCADCRLLVYCSRAHQKLDRPRHRRFCQAVGKIATKLGYSHIFERPFHSPTLWRQYRTGIVNALIIELLRDLTNFEHETLISANVCRVCFRYDKSMITCNTCSFVLYCCSEHKLLDIDTHSKLCENFSKLLKIHLNAYTSDPNRFVCEGSIATVSPPDSLESFMTDLVRLKVYSSYLGEDLSKIHASDSFSYQLTTIHALKQSGVLCRIGSCRDLVIHVVGAQDMEASNLNLWKYLDVVIPVDFACIDVVLIGPSLNLELASVYGYDRDPASRFQLKLIKSFYHTFYEKENVASRPPDLIISFNCGFHEFDGSPANVDTWKASIPYFCKHPNTAIAFTSFTKSETQKDFDYFLKYCACEQVKIVEKHKLNPFRSMKPCYDVDENPDTFFYFNEFITILRTEPNLES
ncbi:uncharacterized protein LOC111055111 [Nilaparvata lugens]|uniref:uncharacterized protein LOC111055111 n=1 Tax=Nilaparvata lugens TaxID=108931 RepID=UPI00193E65A3|nr:uncharacterized protein LOC111055111 [Nilaparvata lugens]